MKFDYSQYAYTEIFINSRIFCRTKLHTDLKNLSELLILWDKLRFDHACMNVTLLQAIALIDFTIHPRNTLSAFTIVPRNYCYFVF